MSVFIRVERKGAKPHLLTARGLRVVIGEDERGVILCGQPTKPLFEIESQRDSYLLKPLVSEGVYCEKPLAPSEKAVLKNSDELRIEDYCFTFIGTSPHAEILAAAESINDLQKNLSWSPVTPEVSYQVGTLSRKFPVLENIKVTIGSAESCSIQIPLRGVSPTHCSILREVDSLILQPEMGILSLENAPIEIPLEIREETFFRLDPSGMELKISFPQKN